MRVVSRFSRGLVAATAVVTLLLVSVSVASAAFSLRAPQIVGWNSAPLQGYLSGVPQAINVLTDQLNAQAWSAGISGNATFTLRIEISANAAGNSIGVYNTGGPPVPPLYQIFPGAATAGWFATTHFGGGNLVVTLFDNNSIIQGQVFYAGVNANAFGFYISGPGGTFYSQDSRNGGNAQVLTYQGTGQAATEFWECFEDTQFNADSDFDDAILIVESIVPTSTDASSWGKIKTLYRK